jgi:hypothetical protein
MIGRAILVGVVVGVGLMAWLFIGMLRDDTRAATAAAPTLTAPPASTGRQVRIKSGAVYCISSAALNMHASATERGDLETVRRLLITEHRCDYLEAPATGVLLENAVGAIWIKVRLEGDAWRKTSKVSLATDQPIFLKRRAATK